MTANELNAESARALAAVVNHHGKKLKGDARTGLDVIRVVEMCAALQEQLAHAFARIEALEAAAREREGDL